MKKFICGILSIFIIIGTIIALNKMYQVYQSGNELHWIFEEIPLDTSIFETDNCVRFKYKLKHSNTVTLKVTEINPSMVFKVDNTSYVDGVLLDKEKIKTRVCMTTDDICTINIGDIITVTGLISYNDDPNIPYDLQIGEYIQGGAFSKYNPARFSKEH